MKYYFAEAYNPEIKFKRNNVIIALTPLTSYELDREGDTI